VLGGAGDGVLVTFGDSITDGDQSTPDRNGSWPAVLAARLQGNRATRGVGVGNAGISGNRVFRRQQQRSLGWTTTSSACPACAG
jgi:lysophospholipase L1-like esterase